MTVPAFPVLPGLVYPVKRTPTVLTARNEAVSGKRTVLPQRSTPRHVWELGVEFMRSKAWQTGAITEFETFIGFVMSCLTAGSCFSYLDAEDQVAANQPFGQGDGITTQFQLVRSLGGFAEPVYLPTITTIKVAGTPTAAYTLGATGIVTFTVAPVLGASLVWNGIFAWLCRFDDDAMETNRFMSGLYEAKSIAFSSEINP